MTSRNCRGTSEPSGTNALSRRTFLGACAVGAVAAGTMTGLAMGQVSTERPSGGSRRTYNLSISTEALDADPELLGIVRDAGVTDIWFAGFLYGYWYFSIEKIQVWRERAEKAGLGSHIINVPLGHPGDSLGSKSGALPLTPPSHWHLGYRPDGTTYAGTSLHPPATEENVEALRLIEKAGYRRAFLDDDFRLAVSPGTIGGCFCDEHKKQFLESRGYGEGQWTELLDAVKARRLTPVLDEWITFTCDQLTGSFRAQQAAAPKVQLGNMIMYMGAEKAGIRLDDYRDVPFRVGELMFSDSLFSSVKGKTDELFSALFHRRYARPDLAFSETTAYPADQLSANNMAAKLAVSTISDVRNTMYMSGITAFPRTHWQTLGPAMKRNAEVHEKLAGHTPRGPFKHFWGEYGRKVSEDEAYSLFLASGVPFEVCDSPAREGWVFMGKADADGMGQSAGEQCRNWVVSKKTAGAPDNVRVIPESLADLFAFKREIAPALASVPYVEDEKPVVCAWYPTARAALLWNLSEQRETFSLRMGDKRRTIEVDGLGIALAEGV